MTFIENARGLSDSPKETIINAYQHPGYPALILAGHKFAEVLNSGDTLESWILSAQFMSLFSRILAIVVLFYIGKSLIGSQLAFAAVLILTILPEPAEFGSDALSDWPNMLFLTTGVLLLIHAAKTGRWWIFAPVGLVGGLGYLIRPECAQVVIYGFIWLMLQLFSKNPGLSRPKIAVAIVIMFAGFGITAGPYMQLKGALFPKKELGEFAAAKNTDNSDIQQEAQVQLYAAEISAANITRAAIKLLENTGQTLMWFFLLPLIASIYINFRQPLLQSPGKFFIIAIVTLNILLLIWLYCRWGYMSSRHSLPLVVFTIFYIPAGIHGLSQWLSVKVPQIKISAAKWPIVLTVAGIVICTPKLLQPIHNDKMDYRLASEWIAVNTREDATFAVQDVRISFYAQRNGIKYENEQFPEDVDYIVRESEVKIDKESLPEIEDFKTALSITGSDSGKEIIIYKKMSP